MIKGLDSRLQKELETLSPSMQNIISVQAK